MKRILVATIAVGLMAGLNPAAAAGPHGRVSGGTQGMGMPGTRGTTTPDLSVEPMPHMPNLQRRIPAPLPEPAQPPVVNGPVGPSGIPPMGNGL